MWELSLAFIAEKTLEDVFHDTLISFRRKIGLLFLLTYLM